MYNLNTLLQFTLRYCTTCLIKAMQTFMASHKSIVLYELEKALFTNVNYLSSCKVNKNIGL